MSISIGTGSWRDDAYAGLLFPKQLAPTERLSGYARFFGHVELNATYHALPNAKNMAGWEKLTPPGFLFDVKLSRDFCQDPRGAVERGLTERFLAGVRPVIAAKKLGVFLLVLEPGFGPESHQLEELEPLIEALKPHMLAVELRHKAWVNEERRAATLAFFRKHELVWVAVDMPQIANSTIMPPLDEVANPRLAYLRLHGRNPDWLRLKGNDRHNYFYNDEELDEIVSRVKSLAARATDVRVVANNHYEDIAARTALELKKRLGQPVERLDEVEQGELF